MVWGLLGGVHKIIALFQIIYFSDISGSYFWLWIVLFSSVHILWLILIMLSGVISVDYANQTSWSAGEHTSLPHDPFAFRCVCGALYIVSVVEISSSDGSSRHGRQIFLYRNSDISHIVELRRTAVHSRTAIQDRDFRHNSASSSGGRSPPDLHLRTGGTFVHQVVFRERLLTNGLCFEFLRESRLWGHGFILVKAFGRNAFKRFVC